MAGVVPPLLVNAPLAVTEVTVPAFFVNPQPDTVDSVTSLGIVTADPTAVMCPYESILIG